MEAARDFVTKHTSRTGHFTDVEENVLPAVTWEQVHPTRHEITTEAVDKEVHRHHYHTTVQPLSHSVTLPEKHTHNLVATRSVVHQNDDVEATKRRLNSEAALFKNTSVTLPHTHSTKQMPAVIGTHYHHHVHETVQPIIYKETIMPEVVHTTIPIHERHHMKAEHHTMSSLPMKTMAEFQAMKFSQRGVQKYDGAPRAYNDTLHTTFEKLGLGIKEAVKPKHHNNDLTVNTTPAPMRRSSSISSHSSSSSDSSVSSLEQPMTPRSPRHNKHATNLNTIPTKEHADRPVQIVDGDSPRLSNDSTGRRGFMSRLTGRA